MSRVNHVIIIGFSGSIATVSLERINAYIALGAGLATIGYALTYWFLLWAKNRKILEHPFRPDKWSNANEE